MLLGPSLLRARLRAHDFARGFELMRSRHMRSLSIPSLVSNVSSLSPPNYALKLQKALDSREMLQIMQYMPETARDKLSGGLIKSLLADLVKSRERIKDRLAMARVLVSELEKREELDVEDVVAMAKIQADAGDALDYYNSLDEKYRVPDIANIVLSSLKGNELENFWLDMQKDLQSHLIYLERKSGNVFDLTNQIQRDYPQAMDDIKITLLRKARDGQDWKEVRSILATLSETAKTHETAQMAWIELAGIEESTQPQSITDNSSDLTPSLSLALWSVKNKDLSIQEAEDAHKCIDEFEANTGQLAPIELYVRLMSRLDAKAGLDLFRRAKVSSLAVSSEMILPLLTAKENARYVLSLDECFEIFLALPLEPPHRDGPSLEVYEALLDHCASLDPTADEVQRQSHYSIALSVLSDMAKMRVDLPISTGRYLPDCMPSLLRLSDQPKSAFEMYCALHKVASDSFSPQSYAQIMQSLASSPDIVPLKWMQEILLDMRAAGFVPDNDTYKALVVYYSHDAAAILEPKDRYSAIQNIHAMARMDPTLQNMNIDLMGHIMQAYASVNAHRKVYNIWEHILLRGRGMCRNEGCHKDLKACVSLAIHAAQAMKRPDRIQAVWQRAAYFDLVSPVDGEVYSAYLRALCESDAWDKAFVELQSNPKFQLDHVEILYSSATNLIDRDRLLAWLEHEHEVSKLHHCLDHSKLGALPSITAREIRSLNIDWLNPARDVETRSSHPTHTMTMIGNILQPFKPGMMQRNH